MSGLLGAFFIIFVALFLITVVAIFAATIGAWAYNQITKAHFYGGESSYFTSACSEPSNDKN